MPKVKSHSGAKKRLSKTGTGKLKRARANKSHILTHKSRDRKRKLNKPAGMFSGDEKKIKPLVPYL